MDRIFGVQTVLNETRGSGTGVIMDLERLVSNLSEIDMVDQGKILEPDFATRIGQQLGQFRRRADRALWFNKLGGTVLRIALCISGTVKPLPRGFETAKW